MTALKRPLTAMQRFHQTLSGERKREEQEDQRQWRPYLLVVGAAVLVAAAVC